MKRRKKPTLGKARQSPKEVTGNGTARACRHSRTNGMNDVIKEMARRGQEQETGRTSEQ